MVIVIIAVLAAIVAPGVGSLEGQRQDAAFDEVSRALRYARANAMAAGSPTGVRIRTDTGIRLEVVQIDPDTDTLEPAPGPLGEDAPVRYLDIEIPSLAVDSMTNGDGTTSNDETFWFRYDGTPHTRSATGVFDAINDEDALIVLEDGTGTRTIVIRQQTGLIDEQ